MFQHVKSPFEKSRLESRLQAVGAWNRLKAGLQTRRTHAQQIFQTRSKLFLFLMSFVAFAFGQNADQPDEPLSPPPLNFKIPPAPPLSPEQALKTFQLQPGFRIELIAAEPLVQAPVAIQFDAN